MKRNLVVAVLIGLLVSPGIGLAKQFKAWATLPLCHTKVWSGYSQFIPSICYADPLHEDCHKCNRYISAAARGENTYLILRVRSIYSKKILYESEPIELVTTEQYVFDLYDLLIDVDSEFLVAPHIYEVIVNAEKDEQGQSWCGASFVVTSLDGEESYTIVPSLK